MGLNTTITGPVQIRTRLATGAAGFPTGAILPRELFFNRADQILYAGLDTVDGNGFATAAAKIGGAGAFLLASLLGAANGVAPLDSNNMVPYANLPPGLTGAMTYQGTWNPNTNTPQLLSGVGTKGYVYKTSVRAMPVTTTAGAGSASGATTLTVASSANLTKGMLITGTNLAANTTVSAISGTTITFSPASTGAISNGQTLKFSPYLDGLTMLYPGDQVVYNGTTWDKIEGSPTEVYTVAGQTGDVTLAVTDIAGAAPLASPAFSGIPTAPNPPAADNSSQLTTSAWVTAYFASLASPSFTGTPSAPTANLGTNTTQIATTAFTQAAVAATVARKAVNDAAVTVAATDRTVAYTALSAARAVSLPAASAYPLGTMLTIVDESGACSGTNTITIARNGTDTINGGSSYVLASPYSYVALQSNGATKWTVIDALNVVSVAGKSGAVTLVSGDISDSGSFGRTVLATSTQQGARDALGVEAYVTVNDANATAAATSSDVVMSAMSAARTITLPAANTVKAGRTITIGDDSGACSSVNTITVAVTGSDTISGASTDVMTVAYSQTRYRSNGSNKWSIVSKVPATSAGGVDGGTV